MLLLTASRRRSSPRLRLLACCARAKYSLAHLRCKTGDIISYLVLAQRLTFRLLRPEESYGRKKITPLVPLEVLALTRVSLPPGRSSAAFYPLGRRSRPQPT